MIQCPTCDANLPPKAAKCACGWIPPQATNRPRQYDPDIHLCAWTSFGKRCRYPGSISDSTTGGGRWLCARHFRCTDQQAGDRIVTESLQWVPPQQEPALPHTAATVEQLRAKCRSLLSGFNSSLRGLDWATKLYRNQEGGLELMPIQVSMMESALRIGQERATTPLESTIRLSESHEYIPTKTSDPEPSEEEFDYSAYPEFHRG